MAGQIGRGEDQLLSILLPTHMHSLLVPNVVVAEIIEMSSVNLMENAPSWQGGTVDWRGQDLPLLMFERFLDSEADIPMAQQPIVAVINHVTGPRLPAYGLICRAIPKLITVKADDIETLEPLSHEAERARVRIQLEEAIVPNLEYLESQVEANG